MHLRIIVTGGTFDKEYDEVHGRLFFLRSHVEEMLQRGRCKLRVAVDELMMLDSLDMTVAHREQIVDACRHCEESSIVVTHGTDTMVDTAHVLADAQLDKTIVLTGAMIPYAFGSSDGLFNLGSALSFAQALPVGVYIAMNGRWFHHDNVRKNRELGVFEAISAAELRETPVRRAD
jgi:L-asparaginase